MEEQNYNVVPSIICEEIKSIMQKAYNVFQNNLNEVLNILKEGGSNE